MFFCLLLKHKPPTLPYYSSVILFAILLLVFPACNTEEEEPAYLTIDNVVENSSGLEAAALAITEVWVFANGTFLGAYALPARIPVLLSGETAIEVRMGIRVNGINETPDTYPFYAPVFRSIELIPGNIHPLGVLPVRYDDSATFLVQDDFEEGTPRAFTQLLVGQRGIEADDTNAFEGNGSGLIRLDEDNLAVEVVTEELFSNLTSLSQGNIWLEVSYLSEAPVLWGVVGSQPNQPLEQFYELGFRPRANWQKIYFNLTRTIVTSDLESVNFGLRTFLSNNEQSTANVWLDNIRIIYEVP